MSRTPTPAPASRDTAPGELGVRELLRWTWRQWTSMRTALILLLILALAAIPGSIVPQRDVDSLKTSQWQQAHPKLTPVYEKLGLFSVYDSVWFTSIFIALVISLIGCIVPRLVVYARALRTPPPAAPQHLTRLPDHTSWHTDASAEEVLEQARRVLRKRRFRVRADADGAWVAAERGYLREAGNLLFHLAVVVVLAGFAAGGLLGYQGGVILTVGNGFSNNLTQYDDFVPGSLFRQQQLDDFSFDIDDFDITWLHDGPAAGQARKFVSHLTYREGPDGEEKSYPLRVNHPLTIGSTGVFLIGHGYAPVITVRDGNGDIAYSGPTPFLPTDNSFRSFGVIKAADARPTQIGLDGEFYPTVGFTEDRFPYSAFGDDLDPFISMTVWTGDLGMDDGDPQSIYVLERSELEPLTTEKGTQARVDLRPGETQELPNGAGSVTFEEVAVWNKLQISQTPGMKTTLAGVVAALIGLLGSLFVRPRRVWVRVRPDGDRLLVELAALDRSSGGEVATELEQIHEALVGTSAGDRGSEEKA